MFPYLTKIIEIGLRRAAIIPFSVVPCLDSVDFYACLTPVLSLALNEDNSDRSKTNMVTENCLYYTTLTNLALSSIERPELSFDFGCWTRGGVIFGIYSVIGHNVQAMRLLIGYIFCQLALPLYKTTFSLVDYQSFVTRWVCRYTLHLFRRTPSLLWIDGVSLVKINVERCSESRMPAIATTPQINKIT